MHKLNAVTAYMAFGLSAINSKSELFIKSGKRAYFQTIRTTYKILCMENKKTLKPDEK